MSGPRPIDIIPDVTNVNIEDVNRTITVVDDCSGTSVDVTQPITTVIQVSDAGLQGPQGPQGPAGATQDTGSLLTTASIDQNTISFTKGDSTTFTLTVASGSFYGSFTGSLQGSASYALTASYAQNAGTTVDTGSFVTTSSFNAFTASYSTGSFTGSFTGSLVGTASWAANATSASTTTLQSDILTNITVGALSSGTTLNSGSAIENILRQILITYIAPTISGLTMKNGATTYSTSTVFEPSQSFNVATASWTATNDNPDGNAPQSISLTGSNAFIGTQQFSGLTGTNYNFAGGVLNFSRYTSGSIVFRLNALDKNGSAITGSTATFNFQWPWYYGLSANTDLDENGVEALTKVLASTNSAAGTKSFSNGTSVYVYIAVPSVFPMFSTVTVAGSSLVFNNITPYNTAQTSGNTGYTYKTLSVTNAYNATTSYRVYRSLNTFASLTTSDSLVIT